MNRRKIRRRRRRDSLWNRLSCAVVLLVILLTGWAVVVMLDPSSKLNPFPPPVETGTIDLPGADETARVLKTTAEPSPRPSGTNTPSPTETAAPSATEMPTLPPTITPTATANNGHNPATTPIPTKTLDVEFPFTLYGVPKLLDASTFNPKHTCSWQGVGGQTFDLLNRPLPGILVQVSGQLGAEKLEMISMSGTVLTYGEAGYEIFLTDQILESHESLAIRLIDDAGKPISEQYVLDTSGDCRQNLVIVNFKKVK